MACIESKVKLFFTPKVSLFLQGRNSLAMMRYMLYALPDMLYPKNFTEKFNDHHLDIGVFNMQDYEHINTETKSLLPPYQYKGQCAEPDSIKVVCRV